MKHSLRIQMGRRVGTLRPPEEGYRATAALLTSAVIVFLAFAGIEQSRAATVYWYQAPAGNWSNNWSSSSSSYVAYTPTNGDALRWLAASTTFPSSTNDLVGLSIASISFQAAAPKGPFVLNGNELTITGDINGYLSTNTFNLAIKLNGSSIAFAPGGAGGIQTFNGVISEASAGKGIIFNTGTIHLNGSNTYSGTCTIASSSAGGMATVNINTLAGTNVAQSLGKGTTVLFGSVGNSTLAYSGGATTTDKKFRIGSSTAGATGSGSFYNNGSGAVVWSGAQLAAGATNPLAFTLGGSNTNDNDWQSIIADNNASGTIGITKVGTGKWILSGANTYTGPTIVSNGTLLINGLLGGAGSNVTVFSGAALGGTGTINRAITVNSGASFAPGASVGTLTVTGNVTLAESAVYQWEYKDGAGDRVAVNGILTLPSVATVTVSQVSGSLPVTPTLFTFTSRGDTNTLATWVVQGLSGYKAAIAGNSVVLSADAKGTVIAIR